MPVLAQSGDSLDPNNVVCNAWLPSGGGGTVRGDGNGGFSDATAGVDVTAGSGSTAETMRDRGRDRGACSRPAITR
jgi:hypothetical protein